MNQEQIKRGISFIRLCPFLNMDFKEQLADGRLDIRKYFQLDSEVAYRTLLAIIRDDVESNKILTKVSSPDKKKWYNRII